MFSLSQCSSTVQWVQNCLNRKQQKQTEVIVNSLVERITAICLENDSYPSLANSSESPGVLCPNESHPAFYSFDSQVDDYLVNVIQTCQQNNLIKLVQRPVLAELKASIKVSLTDISVKCRGPDEILYNKNEVLRTYVPRGFTLMQLVNEVNGTTQNECVIYANKKFCGFDIDEDNFNVDSSSSEVEDANDGIHKSYFINDVEKTDKIIAMEKVNGEAAHFTGRFIEGEFFLVAGSKNVHLIFQNEEHIEAYSETRYSVAKVIAFAVLDKWRSLDEERRSCLAQFLHLSKTTVVCEIMLPHHQHVVNFGNLDYDKLVVIALTPPPEQYPTSLTAMPSEAALDFFAKFGFDTPEYETKSLLEIAKHIEVTRQEKNTEGVVYYYEDGEENTIGMIKLKSSWYIHLRALREQAAYRHHSKKPSDKTFEHYKSRARKRMMQLQSWLHTLPEHLEKWMEISDKWMDWIEVEVNGGNFKYSDIKENFPYLWQIFSEQSEIINECLL